MVFQILHSDETTFPFNRFYRFESMEDDQYLPADSQAIRQAYLEAFQAHQKQFQEALHQTGIDATLAKTDDPPDRVLAKILNNPLRAKKLRRMY